MMTMPPIAIVDTEIEDRRAYMAALALGNFSSYVWGFVNTECANASGTSSAYMAKLG